MCSGNFGHVYVFREFNRTCSQGGGDDSHLERGMQECISVSVFYIHLVTHVIHVINVTHMKMNFQSLKELPLLQGKTMRPGAKMICFQNVDMIYFRIGRKFCTIFGPLLILKIF